MRECEHVCMYMRGLGEGLGRGAGGGGPRACAPEHDRVCLKQFGNGPRYLLVSSMRNICRTIEARLNCSSSLPDLLF